MTTTAARNIAAIVGLTSIGIGAEGIRAGLGAVLVGSILLAGAIIGHLRQRPPVVAPPDETDAAPPPPIEPPEGNRIVADSAL